MGDAPWYTKRLMKIVDKASIEEKSLLKKFWISQQDLEHVRAAGKLLEPVMDDFVEDFYRWLADQVEYELFFGGNTATLERVRRMQSAHWRDFFNAPIDGGFIRSRRHIGAIHAKIGLPNEIYCASVSVSTALLFGRLHNLKLEPADIGEMITSVSKLIYLETYLVLDEISKLQKETIDGHNAMLLQVSTPVTPIWEGILLLPLVGIIDSSRTQDIMNKVLSKIAEMRTKVFVLDISGVGAVDTSVANQLIRITKATRLMGCESIISGISPSIARTLVELGVNVGEVKTTSTLRDAFESALKITGEEILRHQIGRDTRK